MKCPLKTSPAWKALVKANIPNPYVAWDLGKFDPNQVPIPEGYHSSYTKLMSDFGSENYALRAVWKDFYNKVSLEEILNSLSTIDTSDALDVQEPIEDSVTNEEEDIDDIVSYGDDSYENEDNLEYRNPSELNFFEEVEERQKPLLKNVKLEDYYSDSNEDSYEKPTYSKTITMLSGIEGMPSIEELNNMSEEQLGEILKQLCK